MLQKNLIFKSFIKILQLIPTMIINRKIIQNIKFKNLKKLEDYIFKCEIFKKNKNLEAVKFKKTFAFYRILNRARSSEKFKNIYYLWKYNKIFNKLTFGENLSSLLSISLNSLRKYGFK